MYASFVKRSAAALFMFVLLGALTFQSQAQDGTDSSQPAAVNKEEGVSGQSLLTASRNEGDLVIEGNSFRRPGGLFGGSGLFGTRRNDDHYPLFETSTVIESYTHDTTPVIYHDDHHRDEIHHDYDSDGHSLDHFIDEEGPEHTMASYASFPYQSSPLTGQHTRMPLFPPMNSNRYTGSRHFGGSNLQFGSSSQFYGHGGRPDRMHFSQICCADCPKRNIQCLSVCKRTGCVKVETCSAAGDGAYAAFCQARCQVMMGMSLRSVDFLPDKACRGHCAGNVQRLCAKHHCTDHGCYAADCGDLAPLKCL